MTNSNIFIQANYNEVFMKVLKRISVRKDKKVIMAMTDAVRTIPSVFVTADCYGISCFIHYKKRICNKKYRRLKLNGWGRRRGSLIFSKES